MKAPERVLYFATQEAWRAWLAANHDSEKEAWVKIKKAKSEASGIRLEEAVMEALCYGWIDSVMRSVDADFFIQRFTPRKPGSVWSKINKDRVCQLLAEGKMTEAGMKLVESAMESGWWEQAYSSREAPVCPEDLEKQLKEMSGAFEAFQLLTNSEQLRWIFWIRQSKNPQIREKRILEIVERVMSGTEHTTAMPRATIKANKK